MAREGDDLAVISPEPISQQNIVEFVTNPSAGGIAVFIGTTRDNFKGM
jgi:molybdopterin synthase catalytic subunit